MRLSAPLALALGSAVALASPLPSQLTFSSESGSPLLSLVSSVYAASSDLFTPRLVQTAEDQAPYWALPQYLRWKGIKFADVTDHLELGTTHTLVHLLDAQPAFPTTVSYQDQLSQVHKSISDKGPRENLAKFTSFRNRYYKSDTGKQSQQWLLAKVKEISSSNEDIQITEFHHPWGQNSIIAHIPATNKTAAKENGLIVVGSHQDSLNLLFPYFPAPGADDDGSGTVTQLESLRALLAQGWKPDHHSVEYHFYSAEEGGLLGSQAVAQAYAQKEIKVAAMSQFDMTAFVKAGTEPTIGVITDFVSPDLTDFNKLLIKKYLDVPAVDTKLGYAGSDHASWTKIGVPSAFSVEAKFDDCNLRRIHTTGDTFDHPEFSFEHLLRFSKLSTAFIVELAGWAKK